LPHSPNFFCIGAQKSGTTLLYNQLRKIDSIYLSKTKETHFFDRPSAYKKGIHWYTDKYFKNAGGYPAIGEVTPSYLFIDFVPKMIHGLLGKDIKFLVMLRDPVERAYSHYLMRFKRKEEDKSFYDALILEHIRTERSLEDKKKFSYLQRGLYAKQIKHYLKWFDRKNFLFIIFDDFIDHQDLWVQEICSFLGVEKKVAIENGATHSTNLSMKEKIQFSLRNKIYNPANVLSSNGYPAMNADIRKILQEYFAAEIADLEHIIDRDLSAWLR
jgi:hypothetical protein